jgi:hypothetical protein
MPTINPENTALLRQLQGGEDLPLYAAFRELAEEYHRRNPGTRNVDLANLLGTRPQAVSQWKSGSDPRRRPPWSAIMLLCELCKRQITVTPSGVRVARLRRSK